MGTLIFERVLALFRDCQRSGEWAQAFMETRGSALTATFSVRCENGIEEKEGGKLRKKMTRSRRRRNLQRRRDWLDRKQGVDLNLSASQPAEKDSVDSEEYVDVDDNSKKLDKGPVWKVDNIPQIDGNSEAPETSVDNTLKDTNEIFKEQVDDSDTVSEIEDERLEVENLRIFVKSDQNLSETSKVLTKNIQMNFKEHGVIVDSI